MGPHNHAGAAPLRHHPRGAADAGGPRWRTHPWCPGLGWSASVRTMTDVQYESLVRDSRLARRRWCAGPIVPPRLRSAEIFGDEKALERLATTSLFGHGRLTFDLLGPRRLPPAAPHRRNRQRSRPPRPRRRRNRSGSAATLPPRGASGASRSGAGQAFLASAATITLEQQAPERVFYWGDLDPKGVAIPTEATRMLATLGITLNPAVPLWRLMLLKAHQSTGSVEWRDVPGTWLGFELWSACEPLRKAKARVVRRRC